MQGTAYSRIGWVVCTGFSGAAGGLGPWRHRTNKGGAPAAPDQDLEQTGHAARFTALAPEPINHTPGALGALGAFGAVGALGAFGAAAPGARPPPAPGGGGILRSVAPQFAQTPASASFTVWHLRHLLGLASAVAGRKHIRNHLLID